MSPIWSQKMDLTAVDILRRCGLFMGLGEDSLSLLGKEAVRRRFSRGQMIFMPGDECPAHRPLQGPLPSVGQDPGIGSNYSGFRSLIHRRQE